MNEFDTQQVCENGHKVTGSLEDYPGTGRAFCASCGARTLSQCQHCGARIPGRNRAEDYLYGEEYTDAQVATPEFCASCGASFPWSRPAGAMPDRNEVRTLLDRFHVIVRQLRRRHGNRDTLNVKDEYDAQDLLHALLLLFFDDVRPEEWTPSYAGGSARMDFLLKGIQTVIEVKKWRTGHTAKELGDELLVDIGRYKVHPNCKRLVCFVYDPEGQLQNPRGMETDLSKTYDGVDVVVLIRPT